MAGTCCEASSELGIADGTERRIVRWLRILFEEHATPGGGVGMHSYSRHPSCPSPRSRRRAIGRRRRRLPIVDLL